MSRTPDREMGEGAAFYGRASRGRLPAVLAPLILVAGMAVLFPGARVWPVSAPVVQRAGAASTKWLYDIGPDGRHSPWYRVERIFTAGYPFKTMRWGWDLKPGWSKWD